MRTTVRAIVTAIILLSLSVSVFSQQVAKTIPNSTSPDGLIGFLEFKPKDYGSQKHPLIIFLHGIGERGNGTSQINSVANNAIPFYCARGASMRFTVGGQTSSFVVLSPQLSSQYGYWPTFYVREMIKYAKANLQIDPNRIYITGLSLGGGGTWRMITDSENFDYTFDAGIAAAAPVCGTQEESDGNFCSTIGANHLPVWAFHSMDDGTVGVGATQHAQILANQCGLSPAAKFTYYQNGGHSGAWVNAYDTGHITTTLSGGSSFTASPNLYEWFLSNTRNVSQTPSYTAPTANAGSTITVTLPAVTATLNGSGAGTNGATITSYSWAKTSGPAGGAISVPLTNITLITGLSQGTYVYTLTVTDNHGLSATSSVTVYVNAPTPAYTAPLVNVGSNQTIKLPNNSVTLSGTGTGTNGASISSYAWTKTSGPSGGNITASASTTTSITGLSQGNYVYTFKVTDNHGLTNSATVNVTVNAAPVVSAPAPSAPSGPVANQLPISNPGGDITITLPANSVTLDGSASVDYDGRIIEYYWSKLSGPSATLSSNFGSSVTLSNLVQGVYIVQLQVKDNAGGMAWTGKTITVKAATVTSTPPPATGSPIGYVKLSVGPSQACDDASTSGRIAVYSNSIANGSLLYLDAAKTRIFDGGWNWYSFTPTLGSSVTQAFAVYPNGAINLLTSCSITAPVATQPAPPVSTLLGYIKMSTGPNQACDDASSTGRIAIYGTGIANDRFLYTDAALTQKFDGGWNWFSFTATLGGAVRQSFAIYPNGGILLLTNCNNARVADGAAGNSAEEKIATLQRLKDSALAALNTVNPATITGKKLIIYPNPVAVSATLELFSTEAGNKTIHMYNSSGALAATYRWTAVAGKNLFTLNNLSGLTNGLYIIEVKDSKGRSEGTLKFLKVK